MRQLPAGLLTKVDWLILAALAQCSADYIEAIDDLEKNGWEYTTDKGYQGSRPSVAKMHKALEKIITLSGKLGLSPADRTRLSIPEPKAIDPFTDFLAGKQSG